MSSRARAPDDAQRPFVVASGGHYPRVVAANAAARAAGIRSDQLISAALAFAPDLVAARPRSPTPRRLRWPKWRRLLLAFTPQVSLAPPNAVVAEIDGSVRLFGGLRNCSRRSCRASSRAVTLRDGARTNADGGAPARARRPCAARAATQRIARSALRPLPLALLDLDAERSQRLRPPASRRSARRSAAACRTCAALRPARRRYARPRARSRTRSPAALRAAAAFRAQARAARTGRQRRGAGFRRQPAGERACRLAAGARARRRRACRLRWSTSATCASAERRRRSPRSGSARRRARRRICTRCCASGLRASRCLRRSRLSC